MSISRGPYTLVREQRGSYTVTKTEIPRKLLSLRGIFLLAEKVDLGSVVGRAEVGRERGEHFVLDLSARLVYGVSHKEGVG